VTGVGVARAALAALALAAGCGGATRRADDGARGHLIVRAAVPDATLWIDEAFVAELRDAAAGVRLRPGDHRVEVRHDGHHAFYGEVELAAGERRTLDVELVPYLD
jgi:hypothetical protein